MIKTRAKALTPNIELKDNISFNVYIKYNVNHDQSSFLCKLEPNLRRAGSATPPTRRI